MSDRKEEKMEEGARYRPGYGLAMKLVLKKIEEGLDMVEMHKWVSEEIRESDSDPLDVLIMRDGPKLVE